MPRNILFGLIAAVAAALGLAVGAMLLQPKGIAIASGTLLQTPRPLPDFTLTDQDGQAFTRQQLGGKWTLVFAGFTYCPDVCPATLSLLKAVKARLGPQAGQLQVLLLSVDPGRDTPERLKTYVRFFDPSFLAATAPDAELEKLARAMSFVYAKVPGADADSYTMDHSTALMLINPQAELAGFFTAPLKADTLSADLSALLGKV
ncbi:MAG: SCO family protein [Stagnimonas sp.]|nr:SCO family protein [Stagnimonas sp.]